MKKLSVLLLFLAVVCCTLHSCREEIKTCAGQIRELNDTVMTTKIGDYDIAFDIRRAEYTNGAVMAGDSVTVHYTGDLKDLHARALLVYLMPRPGRVVDAVYDPSKELKVSDKPLTDEEVRKTEQFIKDASRRK